MRTQLDKDKAYTTLSVTDDGLRRQMELKELREAVAEAERSIRDQELRPRAKPLS